MSKLPIYCSAKFLINFYKYLVSLKKSNNEKKLLKEYKTAFKITNHIILSIILFCLVTSVFGQNSNEINPFAKIKYDSIVAYNYNTNDDYNYDEELIVNKKINKGVGITWTKKLQKEEIKQIINILIDTATYGSPYAACFEPRFAIIFFKKAKIVAALEICLECNGLSSTLEIYAKQRQLYVSIGDIEVSYYDALKHIRDDKNTTIRPNTGFTKIGRSRINDFCKQIKMKYITELESIFDE